MKKIVFLISAFVILSLSSVSAQDFFEDEEAMAIRYDNPREISYLDLPEDVKYSFEESMYSHWKIAKVQEVEEVNDTRFIFTITDGDQVNVITFDEDGYMIN